MIDCDSLHVKIAADDDAPCIGRHFAQQGCRVEHALSTAGRRDSEV
jgi:hypothetical protein